MACLIAAGGCGGGARDQFTSRYSAAEARLNQTFLDLASASLHTKGESKAEIAQGLRALVDRFDSEGAALEALKPPAAAATAFRALTTSLNRVESDLRMTYLAFGHGDLVAGPQAIVSLQSDARAATDAAAVVTQKLHHK